jgi:hypothetical protein
MHKCCKKPNVVWTGPNGGVCQSCKGVIFRTPEAEAFNAKEEV